MRTGYSQSSKFDVFVSNAEEEYQLAWYTFYQVLQNQGLRISTDIDFLQGLSLFNAEFKSRLYRYRKVSGEWLEFLHCPEVVTHAFHNKRERSIIVVIKDDVPIERMVFVWWSIVNIRWSNCEENIDAFWGEIRAAWRLDR